MGTRTVGEVTINIVANSAKAVTGFEATRKASREAAKKMKEDMHEAKGSFMVLGEEIGIHLPRHVQTFIAKLPGISSAMSAAFAPIAVVAIGAAIAEAGKKVYEFAEKQKEASEKIEDAWREINQPLRVTNDQLDLANTKLENAILKVQGKPENGINEAIKEAIVSADTLGEKLVDDISKIEKALKESEVGLLSRLTGNSGSSDITDKARELKTQLEEIQAKYDAIDKSGMNKKQIDAERKTLSDEYGSAITKAKKEIDAKLAEAVAKQALHNRVIVPGDYSGQAALASRLDNPDQTKRINTLTDLGFSLSEMKRYNNLSGRNAADEEEKSKLERDKENAEAAKKADEKLLKDFEADLQKKKALWGMSVTDERNFWRDKQKLFKEGSDAYRTVQTKYYAADENVSKEVEKIRKRSKGQDHVTEFTAKWDAMGSLSEKWDEYDKQLAKRDEQRAIMNARQGATEAKWLLATGAIGSHAAALLVAAANAEEYRIKLEVLNNELDTLKKKAMIGADGLNWDPKNAAQQVSVQNQIASLQGEQKLQALEDAVNTFGTTWKGMVNDVFDEVSKKSQETGQEIKKIAESMIDSVNTELAKGMTGGKMRFHQVFQSGAQALAKVSIQKLEGGLGKLGTKSNPMYTKSADMASGLTSGAGKGLLGILNDSNWASSLFGGKLFGAGSFFGARAEGGLMNRGGFYLTGERGPELTQVGSTSRIYSNRDTSKILGGGGDVHNHYNIDARGTDPALVMQHFERALAKAKGEGAMLGMAAMRENAWRTPR